MMEASAIILVDSEGRVRYKIHALKDGALRDPSPFALERIAEGARQLAAHADIQAARKRAENQVKLKEGK